MSTTTRSVRESQDIQVKGGLVLPRRWSIGVLSTLGAVLIAGATWATTTNSRLAQLERAALKADAQAEQLRKMQLTLCLLCTAELGHDTCREACR